MSKKSIGVHLNLNGMFSLPRSETSAEVARRLEEGASLRWPGSVSIHGHMRPLSSTKRQHEQTKPRPAGRQEQVRQPLQSINQRFIDDAKRCAEADRSDPHTFRRVLAHLRSGVAVPSRTFSVREAGRESQ